MPDLADKAETELSQIMARITMATMQSGVKLSATVSKGVALAPYKFGAAAWNVVTNALQNDQGKVSLKQFSQLADGKREVVQLDDKAVAREFERELKRHGVTWSVEQHRDGSRTFHVQGKDAELIQHALGVAATRVDEKIARGAPELQAEQQPVELEPPAQEQEPEHDGTEQKPAVTERDEYDEPVQAESVGGHGTAELREDAPARSAADRDQEVPPRERDEPVVDRPPRQLSARDETREKVAKRIEQGVKQKKDELRQSKYRRSTPGRDAATEAREATRRR